MSIHLNSAGSSLPAPTVAPAMVAFLADEARLGPYEAEVAHEDELDDQVYRRVAALLGAPVAEVALFASATDAWTRIVCNLELPRGCRIWTTPYEYAGSLIALQNLARANGSRLEVIPARPDGDLDLNWIRAELDDRVGLVSMVHVPSATGIVLPLAEVGELLAGSAAVYVVDACQSVGQLPIDVGRIGCDLLTGAGRKFLRGPRGTGFAYVRRSLWDRVHLPFHDLHVADVDGLDRYHLTTDTARRFETAERSGATVAGLLAALEFAGEQPRGASAEVYDALFETVGGLPGVRMLTPGTRRAGIVAFDHASVPATTIRDRLAADGVTGWAAWGSHTPLYLGPGQPDQAERFVRLSVHHYTTTHDIELTARSLHRAVREETP